MQYRKPFARVLFFLFLLICLLAGLVGVVRVPVEAASSSIVISQVYGGGGNAGAPYTNDYVELFNLGSTAVDLSTWSVQYAAATGVTWTPTNLTGSIAPGQYYLVQLAGGANGAALPTPDATGTINMGATAGKIALVNTTTALTGSGCPFDVSVVDFVGYGTTANCSEGGTNAPAPSNTTSDFRNGNGCTESDDNSSDFTTGTPNPRNSSSPISICIPAPEIIISEVAWAGTQASAFDEWIELYNAGSSTVDLTNWRIQAADGDPLITLSGNIAAGSYLVLERGSQNVTNVTGLVYSAGLLADTGEILYLLDDTSAIVDTINSNGGAWPAGGGTPNFPTMERIGNVPDSDYVWVTFASTPFALDAGGNDIYGTPGTSWGFTVTPTFTPTLTLTPTPTFTPSPTLTATPTGSLTILINEVAWAGTQASSSDEWIELYNPGIISVNISGWSLKSADGGLNISLSGIIPAGGYFLLERTDDTTVSDIAADQIYTGDLSNSSEILRLYDPSNVIVDTANGNGGFWPAGNASTHGSMERRAVVADSDTAWITNTGVIANGLDADGNAIKGTPKQANWAFTVTATPSPIPTAFKTATPRSVYVPPPPLLAINEFVPRPGHDWNNDGVIDVGDEYIELINHGVVDVNLSGYRLDDEANIGSSPFSLPAITLKPGERIAFYGSETGLLLSDGGDGVRLLKSTGQLVDAYNYSTVNFPDQAFCRLPDNGGLDDWNTNCYPTPGLPNSLSGSLLRPPTQNNEDEPLCPIADTLPQDFVLAECEAFGHNIWNRYYWDKFGWYDYMTLPNINSKWDLFAD